MTKILKVLDHVYAELNPGDALFLHGNTLHCSAQNKSEHPRWAMICCYNTKHNNPYKKHHHPPYTPLKKVSDDSLKEVGMKRFTEDADVAWLDPEDDYSHRNLKG